MADILDLAPDEHRAHGSGLIQSVVMTAQILEALAAAGQPMRLTVINWLVVVFVASLACARRISAA